MSGKDLGEKQLKLWLVTAMSAPLAQTVGGMSWVTVLVTGIVCGGFLFVIRRAREGICNFPGWLSALAQIWLLIRLLYLLGEAENCWQADQSGAFVPLILLLLGGLSACKGMKAAAGVACILFYFIAAGYGATAVASVKSMQYSWMFTGVSGVQPRLIAAFLHPAVMLLFSGERRPLGPVLLGGLAGVGGILALLINGVLSAGMAAGYQNSFYEMSRSVSFLGSVERIESLTAAILVLGWFAMFSLHFSALSEVRGTDEKHGNLPAWIALLAAAFYLFGVKVDDLVSLTADVTLCLLVVLQGGIDFFKKRKKELDKREMIW